VYARMFISKSNDVIRHVEENLLHSFVMWCESAVATGDEEYSTTILPYYYSVLLRGVI
jgi:hypothetical protein